MELDHLYNWSPFPTPLLSITFGNDVQRIPAYLCYNQNLLTNITIPSSVKSIGKYAFSGCSSLQSFNITEQVTAIEDFAFSECASLNAIEIPDSVTSVGDAVFYNCGNLHSVRIGNNVETIGKNAFYDCGNLSVVTITNTIPPITDNSIFAYCTALQSIYVPCGTLGTYRTANGWSSYYNKLRYEEPLPYTVSFNYISKQGYVESSSNGCADNTTFDITAVPKEGYHFEQWSDGVIDNPRTVTVSRDTTFTAEFAINTYLVRFFGFNGESLDIQSVEHGSAAIAPEAPTVDHYDFAGWDKEFSYVTSDLDIHAQYEKNTEDFENTNINTLPSKMIIGGQVHIIREDKIYTILGNEL